MMVCVDDREEVIVEVIEVVLVDDMVVVGKLQSEQLRWQSSANAMLVHIPLSRADSHIVLSR